MIAIPSRSIRRGVARLRVLSQPIKNKIARVAPRSKNDYATHLPILIGIAQRFTIRQVLELGCGAFSTPTFLNRSVFPDLVRLESYETDHSWLERTATEFAEDDRYQSHFVDGSMSSGVREVKLDTFDLIFVDDSTSALERAETIRELSNRSTPKQLIVIHDFEIGDYREASFYSANGSRLEWFSSTGKDLEKIEPCDHPAVEEPCG